MLASACWHRHWHWQQQNFHSLSLSYRLLWSWFPWYDIACQSLDACDPASLTTLFSVGDFIKKGCGGAGPFPAFRRLDCGRELPKESWDFYSDYARGCLKGDDGIPPSPPATPTAPITPTAPVPVPTSPVPKPAPVPAGNKPTPKPYVPPEDDPKPYIPSDQKDSTAPTKSKKKGHLWRNFFLLCLVAGGCYIYYKRRTDTFNFVRYRRTRNFDYDAGKSEMYSNNSTSFEPPSLPPTPTAMGTEMT